jgi:glycosyltransferase involved in cell wall biosynthesis
VSPLVSTVIPTFDRRYDVVIAVGTALAQTYGAQEIIVVDDGSTDGTAERLREAYGDAVTILHTGHLGVSAARNHGIAAAAGQYIALLDSDDVWAPEKLARQVSYLEARPTFGMVVTDVVQMDSGRNAYDVLRRRDAIPEDGEVFRNVLRQPALAPSSAMFRRRVVEEVGAFDTTLPTAEDIDFHLRVAQRFPIGVIAEPLTSCMRGNGGLSSEPRTYADYMFVMERFLLDHRHEISAGERRAALRAAALRNMRGMLAMGLLSEALALGARVAGRARTGKEVAALARMAPAIVRTTLRSLLESRRERRAVTGVGRQPTLPR